jgi:hypothetical protein
MSTKSLLDLLKEKKAQLSQGNNKTIKPEEGKGRYRILPGWRKDDPTFWHDYGAHYVRHTKGAKPTVYLCLDKTFGKPCPVCDALHEAIGNTHDDATLELLKGGNASQRILLNVLHLSGESPTVPQVMELAPTAFNQILSIMEEWENMLDPTNGNDIVIERTGQGVNTKYSVTIAGKSNPVPAEALKKIVNLDEFVAKESEDQLRRTLLAISAATGKAPAPALAAPTENVAQRLNDVDPNTIDADFKEVAAPTPAPAPAQKAAPAPAPAAAKAVASDDPELNAMLAELGVG